MTYHPREFDYDSLHLIVIPSISCDLFRTFKESQLEFYGCEIQIRTLLQHAFAQVSHDTVYKGPFSESPKIIRTLSTCMALMEVVDKYFASAIEEMRSDSEIEYAFIKRLINLGNTHFMTEFKDDEIDYPFNYSLLRLFQGIEIEIDELEQTILRDRDNVKILFGNLHSYLSRQPVLFLLAYYIIIRREKYLHDKWPLEENILKEVVQKLGHAYPF